MKLKLPVPMVLVVLLVSACGYMPSAQPPGRAVAFLQTGSGIQAVDAAGGAVLHSLPAGTAAPDWHRLYSLDTGSLRLVDTSSGAVEQSYAVPSWATTTGLSPDGRWLVLGPATGSHFEVRDSGLSQVPRQVTLPGSFSFDGMSNDGKYLYLIEWLNGAQYQVRRYDMDAGRLYPIVIADKSELGQPMAGVRVTGLATPEGRWQLSLYTGAPKGAFIHALPLFDQPWAICIDLPGGRSAEAGWSVAMSPNGNAAYAANGQTGVLVEIPIDASPSGRGAGAFQVGTAGTAPAASDVSHDGRTLFVAGRTGLVAIDTATLRQRARGLDGVSLRSLRVSGGWVYALTGAGHLLRIDPGTLGVVADVATGAAGATLLSVRPD